MSVWLENFKLPSQECLQSPSEHKDKMKYSHHVLMNYLQSTIAGPERSEGKTPLTRGPE